jgi:predicted nucleotidyltransferase
LPHDHRRFIAIESDWDMESEIDSLRSDPRLRQSVTRHPYPLLFVTVSGAHLYGFPSPDSDYDLRGVHRLPLEEVVGLKTGPATIEQSGVTDSLEIDLVTHDAKKFLGLMLKRNGYVLEQLLSPLVLHSTPEHEELKAIATNCVTKHHAHHYLGFAATQWHLFLKAEAPRVKPLLYVYRVLLTGIHLMRTGEVQADLRRLNESFRLDYLPDLIERKVHGAEKGILAGVDVAFHEREYERLRAELEAAHRDSHLPEAPSGAEALNDLLVRIRLGNTTRGNS